MFNIFNLFKKKEENIKNNMNDYIILNKDFENNECLICLEYMIKGDKIKILDGATPLATPFGSSTLTSDNTSMPGFTVVKVTGSNEVVFGVSGNETFTDADVTVV